MIKVGSDFSGIGAFDQALKRLGVKYETVFSCDMDKYARQSYISNYGEPKYYPENVYDRDIPKEPLGIYMTSPPCQAFSLAGNRKGEEDKRGVLFYNSHEFITKNKPRYFIFENVKGLLSDNSGKTFGTWLDMLGGKSVNGNPVIFPREDATPYHIYHKVLNAKHYGVPQNRERIFIIGIRDDTDNNFHWPKPFTLRKKLKNILEVNVDKKYYLSERMIKGLMKEKHSFQGCFKPLCGEEKNANCITTNAGSRVTDNFIKVGYINQDTQASSVFSEEGVSPTLCSGSHGYAQGYIEVKSANKKGFEIANEGDSINLSSPNSETRRGRVGKEVAQTLDTACNQAVMIGAIRGRNPQNPKRCVVGFPTEQMLELNMNGTSNAFTTVQKDNDVVTKNYIQHDVSKKGHKSQQYRLYYENGIAETTSAQDWTMGSYLVKNNLFNTDKRGNFNGKINSLLNEERNTIKILSALQQEIGTQEIETWGLRILEVIREQEILQQRLYEESLQGKTKKTSNGIIDKVQPKEGKRFNANVVMRSLPQEAWKRCSSQRRKSIKQLIRQLNESLQIVSHEDSQSKTNLQNRQLSKQIKRLWILQQALHTIQETWESNDNKISKPYRIRRLTVRECFRLMDFPDSFKLVCSDTQLYKQAGNSIVVNVLCEIIKKLNL